MRLVVIIATAGRPELIAAALGYLERQTRRPDEVVLSVPDASHIGPYPPMPFPVVHVSGPRGSSTQRNTAIDRTLPAADIVTFFDDDFFPARSYLAAVEQAFADNPRWAALIGHAVHDGASGRGLTVAEAEALMPEVERGRPAEPETFEQPVGGYGCNMSVRAAFIGAHRFDERLVLYGWQEDVDFTSRLRARGPIMSLGRLRGIHLGIKGGRVSGVRFGYSQVVNPIYLILKGTMPVGFAARLMVRNLVANLGRSIKPEPWIDRRGRLKGNLLGLLHVVTGRIEPEHILEL